MKIRQCIIPVAGRGTRFLPVTKSISKEMLPIVNNPTILLLVKECYESGIEEIIFVVGKHNYDLIKNFFTPNQSLEEFLGNDTKKESLNVLNNLIANMQFHYVFQDENIRGTAGAIYSARDYIKDEYFGVLFGDDIIDANPPALAQLITEYHNHNCNVMGVHSVPFEKTPNYGVVKYLKDNIVESIIEKPKLEESPSNHIFTGRLILHSTVFDKILNCEKHNNNEYHIVEAMMQMHEEIRTVEYSGDYYDIGSHLGYVKANIAYGLKQENVKEELIEFMKGIK